jgi:hypothetical protein
MNDIRLSIGLPKKQQQQQPTKKRFTAAALIHQKQQLEQQQQLLHQQQQDDDDENQQHETHHVFRIESPKGKQNVWWCHSMGCGSGRIVTIIILFVLTFVWLLTLTLLHAFSNNSGGGGSGGVSAIAPVIERNARDTLKFEVPFTLQPENNNNSRIMTIPLQSLTFERLIRYDVCCTHQAYFVCRSALKNIGVEAYLTSEKNAVIVVIHPDMVGARCVIMWTEKIN